MQKPLDIPEKITQHFGQKDAALTGGTHQGVDFYAPVGTPVKAVATGKVTLVGEHPTAGKRIWIQHDGWTSKYFHLSEYAVSVGMVVSEGQIIGKTGNTGLVTGPHLHLQFERGGVPFDPMSMLNNSAAPLPPATAAAPGGGTYRIQPGDTFWGLENKWGLAHGTLAALNPGIDPKKLKIGMEIKTVGAPAHVQPVERRYYKIMPGDTFWDLENAWQLPHGRLQELNPGVDPRRLQIGQRIRIL